MKRTYLFTIPALLISILACTMPGGVSQSQADLVQTQLALALTATAQAAAQKNPPPSTPIPTLTVTSTVPAAPTAAKTSIPCNLAHFVTDVTIPDNTVIHLGDPFTKTWRLQNAGSCTWTSGYQVVFESGDQMGGPSSQQLTNGTIGPGQTIDLSVNLQAPGSAGTYKGNWKLREPGGAVFGLSTGPFWVQIKAKAAVAVPLPDWPLTQSGSSGPEVKALQHLLLAHGEDLTADGIFGPITRSKVQHFQGLNGLAADGIVGPLTWSKLIMQVQQGSHSQAVRAVQGLLNDKFGYSLAVDGIFGPDTNTAVKNYQADHGLTGDGIVGPITWQSLVGS